MNYEILILNYNKLRLYYTESNNNYKNVWRKMKYATISKNECYIFSTITILFNDNYILRYY